MSIRAITVVNSSGVRQTVSRSLKMTSSTGAEQPAIFLSNGAALLSRDSVSNVFTRTWQDFRSDPERKEDYYLSSVNEVQPDADGMLWIHGDTCTSWLPEHEAVQTYPGENGAGEAIWNQELRGAGIQLFDLCPSCSTCSSLASLRRDIEWCKIALNALKDATLYDTAALDARKAWLISQRAPLSENCSGELNPEDVQAFSIQARQLLWQYVTMVHMWNYVASHTNNRTEITTAPEDSAGISLRTSRALPACNGTSTLQCTVVLSCAEAPGATAPGDWYAECDYDPTMTEPGILPNKTCIYIPTPVLDYHPFAAAVSDELPPDPVTVATGSTTYTYTNKTVTTRTFPVKYAGTYVLSIRFLPFRNIKMTNAAGQDLSISGFDYTDTQQETIINPETGEEEEVYGTGGVPTPGTPESCTNPTEEDYNKAKSYPSRSVSGKATWQINVTWTTAGAIGDSTSTDSYIFRTSKPRAFMDNVIFPTEI